MSSSIVSSAASLYAWLNLSSEILGAKVLLVCKKKAIELHQTDHNQLCLVDAAHVARLEGKAFNVTVDTKRLLAILRQATSEDTVKLCLKDEKNLLVTLHSRSRQACLDVPIRAAMTAMVMSSLPKPSFEMSVPASPFKNMLALTRASCKRVGVAICGTSPDKLYMAVFGDEARSIHRIQKKGAVEAEEVVDENMQSMPCYFRQLYNVGILRSIFKAVASDQRVGMLIDQKQPLRVMLPLLGGKRVTFVVANVNNGSTTEKDQPGETPTGPGPVESPLGPKEGVRGPDSK